MIPGNKLSQVGIRYRWLSEQPDPTTLLDYDLGGIALGDTSQGLQYQLWTFTASGVSIYAQPANGNAVHIFDAATTVQDLSGTFDQNMNTVIAFEQAGQWSYRWYNTQTASMTISDLPIGVDSCKCCFDDRRNSEIANSDVLIFYTLNDNLYFRMQRDRYQTDYLLRSGVGGKLVRVDMNGINRLQIKLRAPL